MARVHSFERPAGAPLDAPFPRTDRMTLTLAPQNDETVCPFAALMLAIVAADAETAATLARITPALSLARERARNSRVA
jgi:hypothetical protein